MTGPERQTETRILPLTRDLRIAVIVNRPSVLSRVNS